MLTVVSQVSLVLYTMTLEHWYICMIELPSAGYDFHLRYEILGNIPRTEALYQRHTHSLSLMRDNQL